LLSTWRVRMTATASACSARLLPSLCGAVSVISHGGIGTVSCIAGLRDEVARGNWPANLFGRRIHSRFHAGTLAGIRVSRMLQGHTSCVCSCSCACCQPSSRLLLPDSTVEDKKRRPVDWACAALNLRRTTAKLHPAYWPPSLFARVIRPPALLSLHAPPGSTR
jgi:hypothetical protein